MVKTATKKVIQMLLMNWVTLLWFELPYKAIGYNIVYPLIRSALYRALKFAGLSYISQETAGALFSSPASLLILLCALLFFAFYVYYEIAALLIYCEKGWQSQHISVPALWKSAFTRSIRLFHYKNLPLFLVLLAFLPFAAFSVTSTVLGAFKLPEFITDFIAESPVLSVTYFGVILLVNIILFLNLFAVPEVVLKNKTFLGAGKASRQLLYRHKWSTLFTIFLTLTFCTLLAMLVGAVVLLVFLLYAKLAFPTDQAIYVFRTLYFNWDRAGSIAFGLFTGTVSSAAIVVLYHYHQNDIPPAADPPPRSFRRFLTKTVSVLAALCLLLIYSETEMAERVIPENPATEIIAHRAGAASAPENTLSALNQAIADQASMAEIDVQRTRDGVLIVMHDTNFRRVAGVSKNVWDTDYAEVSTYDVGTYLGYDEANIPTLDQMLEAAKNRIDLMVELKATGHDENLVRDTIACIRQHKMEDQCILASMNLELLKQVKQLAPELKTVYISAVLLTDDYQSEFVDGYSVETTTLSLEMVVNAHWQNKEVYAWTANSRETIEKILYCRADGLITDFPALATYYLGAEDPLLDFLLDAFKTSVHG